jgi:hypothetical protein
VDNAGFVYKKDDMSLYTLGQEGFEQSLLAGIEEVTVK